MIYLNGVAELRASKGWWPCSLFALRL